MVFWFGEASKVLISTVEVSATFLLALSIYRFPLRYAYSKVALIGFIVSLLGTIMRDWAHIYEYTTLLMVVSIFVLTILILRFSSYFSMIISSTTLLLGMILELGFELLGNRLGLGHFVAITIIESVELYFFQDLVVAVVCTMLIIYLQKKKLGFTFLINKLSINDTNKKFNYIISFILVGFVTVMQLSFLTIMPYSEVVTTKQLIIKLLFSIFYFLIFSIYIIITYKKNKLEIYQKYRYLDNVSAIVNNRSK
jgi:hypothetical protein